MCDFVVKSLGIALALMLAASGATGGISQTPNSSTTQPLGEADVICTAVILGTWRTGDSSNAGSAEASENGRAEIDRVIKGKLSRTKISFQVGKSTLQDGLPIGSVADANSITLTHDLRPGTRYLLFLSGSSADLRSPAVLTYKLDVSIPLAPTRDPHLRLDASSLDPREQEREILAEFVSGAVFVLDSHGNVADAYDYFSDIYEFLGTDTTAFVHDLLDSPDNRLRYFAADKLAQRADQTAVDSLLVVVNDVNLDSWMRVTATWDLGMLHATKAVPDLERLAIADPSTEVRWAALRGLDQLGDCSSTEVLTHALEDSAESNRQLATSIPKKFNAGDLCSGD
jgi:hypothetical protein